VIREKIASDTGKKKMAADLLFMTMYLASLTIANATRPEIFSFAPNRIEYLSAKYIARVDTFIKKGNYLYTEALIIVTERTKSEIP
jgi:archaeal flagellar protein FlaJ